MKVWSQKVEKRRRKWLNNSFIKTTWDSLSSFSPFPLFPHLTFFGGRKGTISVSHRLHSLSLSIFKKRTKEDIFLPGSSFSWAVRRRSMAQSHSSVGESGKNVKRNLSNIVILWSVAAVAVGLARSFSCHQKEKKLPWFSMRPLNV